MASPSRKKFCVLTLHTTKLRVFKWEIHTKYGKILPTIHSIHAWWEETHTETACMCKNNSPRTPSVNEANFEQVQQTFICSSNRSCHVDGQEINKPQTTVWRTAAAATVTTYYRVWQIFTEFLWNSGQEFSGQNLSNQDFCSHETTVYTSSSINKRKFQVEGRKFIRTPDTWHCCQ